MARRKDAFILAPALILCALSAVVATVYMVGTGDTSPDILLTLGMSIGGALMTLWAIRLDEQRHQRQNARRRFLRRQTRIVRGLAR